LDVSQLTTLNNFQKPTHHCQLSSYRLTVQEEGSMYPISGSVSQLPFKQMGLKPYTVYTWKVVNNNEDLLTGTTRTLEDGNLKSFSHIIISITVYIMCCSI
jgi:hypothetical protein